MDTLKIHLNLRSPKIQMYPKSLKWNYSGYDMACFFYPKFTLDKEKNTHDTPKIQPKYGIVNAPNCRKAIWNALVPVLYYMRVAIQILTTFLLFFFQIIRDNNTLVIFNSRQSDSGTYSCEADNGYNRDSASVSIQVENISVSQECTDNPYFANCKLIVKAEYCTNKYYAKFCCKSCTLAGQLRPY